MKQIIGTEVNFCNKQYVPIFAEFNKFNTNIKFRRYSLVLAVLFVLSIPVISAISLNELISLFNFNFFTPTINVTSHKDFMGDNDDDGINDTLMIELETDGSPGTYLFVVSIYNENWITNETSKILGSGINRFNISFPTEFLSNNKFDYTIKIYGQNYSLKYFKEEIDTDYYANYEKGISILNISDKLTGNNSLQLNITINFTRNNDYEIISYLAYNRSKIFSKTNKTINEGANEIIISFDNEAIKNTHYAGKFNLTGISLNGNFIGINYLTAHYDYRDFSPDSYFYSFSDYGFDADNNGLYDFLSLNMTLEIKDAGSYLVESALYDLYGNFIQKEEKTWGLLPGKNSIILEFNGTEIYSKKLDGPFILKYAKLVKGNNIADHLSNCHTTKNYEYSNFDNPPLPEIDLSIHISPEYHYGINNFTANITIANIGSKNAYNVFLGISSNSTYSGNASISRLAAGDNKLYSLGFFNVSDLELNAIADFDGFVEESNKSNNIAKEVIKVNNRPVLGNITDIELNETELIAINVTAVDQNNDNLSYSVNSTKFSQTGSIFSWKTTTIDSGDYIIKANTSDGYLSDYKIFKVTILDRKDIDSDNDGINDSLDRIIGTQNLINTSTLNLSIIIENSTDLSRIFNKVERMELKDGNITIVEFDFNFSNATINLKDIQIDKQDSNASGYVIFAIRNFTVPNGFTKTIYIDRLNISQNGICIKDSEIRTIGEIGNDCKGGNEIAVECDDTIQNEYQCAYSNSTGKYRVTGLKNSGIKQLDFKKQEILVTSESGGGGSGGGSGGGGSGGSSGSRSTLKCAEQWLCDEWSKCIDNVQRRACNDISNCGTSYSRPIETRECMIKSGSSKKPAEKEAEALEMNNNQDAKNNSEKSLPKITGFIAMNPEANAEIGAIVVFLTVVAGIIIYFYLKRD